MSGLSTAQNICATTKQSSFLRKGLVCYYFLIAVNTTTAPINYTLNTNTHIVTNSNSNNSIDINPIDNKKSEIDDLDFDKEIDKFKKLGLYNDYGFSS